MTRGNGGHGCPVIQSLVKIPKTKCKFLPFLQVWISLYLLMENLQIHLHSGQEQKTARNIKSNQNQQQTNKQKRTRLIMARKQNGVASKTIRK